MHLERGCRTVERGAHPDVHHRRIAAAVAERSPYCIGAACRDELRHAFRTYIRRGEAHTATFLHAVDHLARQ